MVYTIVETLPPKKKRTYLARATVGVIEALETHQAVGAVTMDWMWNYWTSECYVNCVDRLSYCDKLLLSWNRSCPAIV